MDINHSGHYPHVTSRQISIAQMCADSGISPMRLKEIIMVIRPFPIRISNQTNIGQDIYSGGYGKSVELSWDQINVASKMGWYPTVVDECDVEKYKDENKKNYELTTVTKKPRRVFDLDIEQLKKNIQINTPTSLYLNFFQYLGEQYNRLSGNYQNVWIDKYQREYIKWLEDELDTPVSFLGTGEDLKEYIKVLTKR